MTEREQVHLILTELGLPPGEFALAGSGVLVLHGLRRSRPMGDLDVFCATRTWFDLAAEGRTRASARGGEVRWVPDWDVFTTEPDDPKRRCDPPYLRRVMFDLEVDVFHGWRRRGVGDFDPALWIMNAEEVAGWPCVPLQFLLDWKREVGRAKDVDDVRLLERHLGSAAL